MKTLLRVYGDRIERGGVPGRQVMIWINSGQILKGIGRLGTECGEGVSK